MKSDLTIIITLYKTPIDKLKTLNQYKNYPILIFDQETENNSKNISNILTSEFELSYHIVPVPGFDGAVPDV